MEREAKMTDSDRIDWLEKWVFERHWDGTLGRPCSYRTWRPPITEMRGNNLREAIDVAMKHKDFKDYTL